MHSGEKALSVFMNVFAHLRNKGCVRFGGGLRAALARTPDPVALQKKHLKATTINREKLRVVLGARERRALLFSPLTKESILPLEIIWGERGPKWN